MHLLLVEDNVSLASWLSQALRRDGFVVDCVGDGEGAVRLLLEQPFDAVILDLGLPHLSGQEVLRKVRSRGQDVPILMLTAEGSLQARIAGLDAGADDYLPKPFDLDELEARLGAIVRRKSGQECPEVVCGSLRLDGNTGEFFIRGEKLRLAPREHAVLEALIRNLRHPVSKSALAERVFTQGDGPGLTTIELCMSRLRKKLAASDVCIITLRGLGYLLTQSSSVAAAQTLHH